MLSLGHSYHGDGLQLVGTGSRHCSRQYLAEKSGGCLLPQQMRASQWRHPITDMRGFIR